MKQRKILIATIIYFFLVNTTYYWEGKMGMFAMVTFLLLILYFLVLTALLLGQTYFSIREKYKNKQRLFLIGFMTLILGLSFLFPGGLINFELFERDSVLIAQREGAANCRTTLKLKANNKFIDRNVCFGVRETTGNYKLKGDTIFFENISIGRHESNYFEFAIVKKREAKNGNVINDLVRFRNYSDTTGMKLWITKNELTK